jgi:hypothetical protein
MNNAKKFQVEYRIASDSDLKKSVLLTQQQAVELQLYCESKGYHHVAIITKN